MCPASTIGYTRHTKFPISKNVHLCFFHAGNLLCKCFGVNDCTTKFCLCIPFYYLYIVPKPGMRNNSAFPTRDSSI